MPRFVLLQHELPSSSSRPTHWDFMLEWGTVLRTWALAEIPALGVMIDGDKLADHRLAYLDYEGPVSHDRGHVTRVEWGMYTLVADEADELRVQLAGVTLRGLVRIAPYQHDRQRVSFSLVGDSSATAGGI